MLGPFEEEEEGTGIASDVVKVQGEDSATPGLLPKGIDPGTVTIPQYRANKTKQHRDCRAFQRIKDQIREDFVCGMLQTTKRKMQN